MLRQPESQFRAPSLVVAKAVELEFTFMAERIWRTPDMPPQTGAALIEQGVARLTPR